MYRFLPWLISTVVVALSLVASAGADDRAGHVQVLREALIAPGNTPVFPSDAAAVSVHLPSAAADAHLEANGSVWLRLRFDRPQGLPASTLLAAHLPSSCGWLDLDLNGQPVHRDVADSRSSTSTCPLPRLFSLPAAGLKPLGNLLDIRLRGPATAQVASRGRAATVSEVWVGPDAELADAQSTASFWQVTAVRIIDVELLLVGGFILMLALANRLGPHLAWFGLAALTWAALLAPVWWTALPLASSTLELLLASLLAPTVAFKVHFLMSFAQQPMPRRLSFALLLQCVLVPVSLALAPAGRLFPVAFIWAVALGLQTVLAVGAYLAVSWRTRRDDAWVMLGIVALTLGVWLVDAAWQAPTHGWPGALELAIAGPYGWSVLLVAVGLRLLYRFNQALAAAEASRLSLESQVRKITAEIEHNFAQLSEMRVEQVTERERKRIAADLHDDLGAKLLTIVHTCDNERIATLGREALDEMRLSVRGLSGRPMRLGDAMADWRAETVQRLGQTNIQVAWNNPVEDVDHILPARAFVQTTRILREAVSNIIKHSGASRCEVKCFAGDGEYGLVVEDNGRGIPMAFDGGLDRGHGMASMKHRAKQLQGQCLVESGAGLGTVIRLTLPL